MRIDNVDPKSHFSLCLCASVPHSAPAPKSAKARQTTPSIEMRKTNPRLPRSIAPAQIKPTFPSSSWLLGSMAPRWRSHPLPVSTVSNSQTNPTTAPNPPRPPPARRAGLSRARRGAQNEARIPPPRSSIHNIIRTRPPPADSLTLYPGARTIPRPRFLLTNPRGNACEIST